MFVSKMNISFSLRPLCARSLYSISALGVDNYVKTREKINIQFHNVKDNFKSKMNNFCQPSSGNMIFTEDLKHMVHLAESNKSDLELVEHMMLKFSQQNKELRFGSFVFGPIVMRMYYHLNKPVEALKIFENPDMDGFFDQLISFQILLDLLFNNEMYNEVLRVFDVITKKQLQGAKYPKNCVVLAFAACYKLNTPESFDYAKKLWTLLNEVGHYPMRRAATFAASLAISQNAPHIALEILTSMKQQTYVTVRNLKVAAFADLGRPDDALPILRAVLEYDEAFDKKHTFAEEIMEKMRESCRRTGKKEIIQEFERIEKELKRLGHITVEPLSDHLCAEIAHSVSQHNKEGRILHASFSNKNRSISRRPGLQDML